MRGRRTTVSIGLPVRNGERFIAEAIESILAQTFADFELIISDNASSDRTPEICRGHAATDQRVRFYPQETNIGAAKKLQSRVPPLQRQVLQNGQRTTT